MNGTYQLLWLGDPNSLKLHELGEAIKRGFTEIGLDSKDDYSQFFETDKIDWRYPVACIWAADEMVGQVKGKAPLKEAIEQGAPVFPVINDLKQYKKLMPEELHSVNGMEWSRGANRLANEVLNSFGLSRKERAVFISYMRRHSSAVATQILHKLTDHGYRPFLDTASVEYGDQFQESLWDSLANTDFLLFLDTPEALSSTWIEQELTRAHNHGMGTLQVCWPGWKGTPGTDLSIRFALEKKDFEVDAPHETKEGNPNPSGRLTTKTLELLSNVCEKVRMRSIGARRTRITGEIVRRAKKEKFSGVTEGGGPVRILRKGNTKACVLPVVGFPDSSLIYDRRDIFESSGVPVAMVYDGLGIKPERAKYLHWLNGQLGNYETISVTKIKSWLMNL